MACKAYKTPFLRYITTRGYAAKAATSAASGKSQEIEVSTLPNKMIVASTDSDLPVSRVSIVFRAGSRNETYDTLGASHILRASGGLTTKHSSGFAITRNLQQMGANLSVTTDREIVAYTVESTCAAIDDALRFLEDAATSPAFKPWELKDISPTFRAHLAARSGPVRAVELLHKAAYRSSGLGNSIYIPKYHIGSISPESLQHYFSSTCTTNRCAVVGVGIDHNMLSGFAQHLCLESGEGAKKSRSEFRGCAEIRKDRSGDMAYVAVAGEGGSLSNIKEALAFAVLQQACGARPSTKRGNFNGIFGKAADCADGAHLSSFNASYTDSGLFGFVVSANASDAGKVVEAAVRALKGCQVSNEDIKRGKALLKTIVAGSHTSGRRLLADIGTQAVLTGKILNMNDLIAAIDGVSETDVRAAGNKAGNSVLCMGASGNLRKVPHVTDL